MRGLIVPLTLKHRLATRRRLHSSEWRGGSGEQTTPSSQLSSSRTFSRTYSFRSHQFSMPQTERSTNCQQSFLHRLESPRSIYVPR